MVHLAERSNSTGFLTILFFAMFACGSCMYISKRALMAPEESDAAGHAVCSPTTPCAWHVYRAFSRELRYIIQNTCECDANTRCVNVDDDVSSTAYVFKCRSVLSLVTYDDDVEDSSA